MGLPQCAGWGHPAVMSVQILSRRPWPKPGEIQYPESDGKPMAENTEQFKWIVFFVENLKSMFQDRLDVFVAGDLLCYPVEGRPDLSFAPDAMVVFGRPPGPRRCYKQWEEGGLPPQVVVEVLSPSNTAGQMMDKRLAYAGWGVEEYYEYDPDNHQLRAWVRRGETLEPIEQVEGYESPRLKVRFWPDRDGLEVQTPDGGAFASHAELLKRVQREQHRVQQERQRAEQERQRAEQEQRRASQAEQEAARLREQLRALGVDPSSLPPPA